MSGIKPISPNTFIVPHGPTPLGGDIHDTFNVDRNGNLSNGHTTARIPGPKQIRIYHDVPLRKR